MNQKHKRVQIEVSLLFREFLDYLVNQGYSDSVHNILEGVFQRAFFDEWTEFLGKRKLLGQDTINYIKEELIE